MVQTISGTDRALAAMFVENTGRHMLDSGGAYGRNWERFQGVTVEGFMERPEVTASVERWGSGDDAGAFLDVTLDLFHYLRRRLEYMALETARLRQFANAKKRSDDSWLAIAAEWAELHHCGESHELDGFNTYNWENLLSQVCQGETYRMKGAWPDCDGYAVALSIHGGCDVRGGYTAPRLFRIIGNDYGSPVTDLFGDADSFMVGSVDNGEHYADYRGDWEFERAPESWIDDNGQRSDFAAARFEAVEGSPSRLRHRDTGEVVEVYAPEVY